MYNVVDCPKNYMKCMLLFWLIDKGEVFGHEKFYIIYYRVTGNCSLENKKTTNESR